MQTFLPYGCYTDSALALDDLRLNKQITETMQICNAMDRGTGGWTNHPATRMWRPYKDSLIYYGVMMYREWLQRGKNLHKSGEQLSDWYNTHVGRDVQEPVWLGQEDFHSSHRARLLHKGNIDVLRKRLKVVFGSKKNIDTFISMGYNTKEVRDLSVDAVARISAYLDAMGVPSWENHYEKFGWSESPSDTYIWPSIED